MNFHTPANPQQNSLPHQGGGPKLVFGALLGLVILLTICSSLNQPSSSNTAATSQTTMEQTTTLPEGLGFSIDDFLQRSRTEMERLKVDDMWLKPVSVDEGEYADVHVFGMTERIQVHVNTYKHSDRVQSIMLIAGTDGTTGGVIKVIIAMTATSRAVYPAITQKNQQAMVPILASALQSRRQKHLILGGNRYSFSHLGPFATITIENQETAE